MSLCLADTNILLRSVDPLSQLHHTASEAIALLLGKGEQVCLAPQNLVEFWAVVTRPVAANGLGWEIDRAVREVESLRAQFPLLEETRDVFPKWLELVSRHRLAGKRVHDARLIAVMHAQGVKRLVTFDEEHFRCFTDITLLSPHRIVEVKD